MPPLPTNPDYAALTGQNNAETSFIENADQTDIRAGSEEAVASFAEYLTSIIFMPHSLRMVCLTNLFCWMAHVCYSLYFTDFVGESVFHGDPKAPEGSVEYTQYTEGVRFGCWGMAMYSLSCACYSMIIERLIKQYGSYQPFISGYVNLENNILFLSHRAKRTYIGGLLFYSLGMCFMAMTRARASVIIFSWGAGVMYSTLFTMPYLLVAHYHSEGTVRPHTNGHAVIHFNVSSQFSSRWAMMAKRNWERKFEDSALMWPSSVAWCSWLNSFYRFAWDRLWLGPAQQRPLFPSPVS